MAQWKNKFGISIRQGCMSCKWSEDADPDLKSKLCTIDDNESTNRNARNFTCNSWSPRESLQYIGSGKTVTGAKASPGPVKTKHYFQWLVHHMDIPGGPAEWHKRYNKEFPSRNIYLIEV